MTDLTSATPNSLVSDGFCTASTEIDSHETPEAYHLYVRKSDVVFGDDAFSYLTATRTRGEADELADILALLDANSKTDKYEKAARFARLQVDRIRRDTASTDNEISAAKETRKEMEVKAFLEADRITAARGDRRPR